MPVGETCFEVLQSLYCESSEFYAPAIVVLLMDLLLEGTKSGMKGGVALIFALFSMLLILTIRQILRNRSRR